MAYRITGKTISSTWNIGGSLGITYVPGVSVGVSSSATASCSVSCGGLSASATARLSGKVGAGGYAWSATANANGDTAATQTIGGGSGIDTLDLTGSASISVPVYLCFEFVSMGGTNPFARAGVVDAPVYRKLRFFLLGAGDATISISFAGASATDTKDVRGIELPASAGITGSVASFPIADYTADPTGEDLDGTATGGNITTMHASGSLSLSQTGGTLSGDGPATTSHATYSYVYTEGAATATITSVGDCSAGGGSGSCSGSDGGGGNFAYNWYAPRGFSVTGMIYAFDTAYSDTLRVTLARSLGDATPEFDVSGGSFSRGDTQHNYSVQTTAFADGGVIDSDLNDLHNFADIAASITAASLTALGDEPYAGRLMFRGWPAIPGLSISQASSFVIDDMGGTQTVTGPATLTRTYTTDKSFSSYRYLRVRLRSTGSAGDTCRINILGNYWNLTTGADGTYVERDIDLCSPDGVSGSALNDAWDSRWPVPTVPSVTSGPFRVGEITFTNIASGKVLEFDSLTLVRVNPPTIDFCPTLYPSKYSTPGGVPVVVDEWPLSQNEDRVIGTEEGGTASDYIRRFLLANSDGRQTVEEPDLWYTRNNPPSGTVSYSFNPLSVSALTSQINSQGDTMLVWSPWHIGTDPAGNEPRWPGWSATEAVSDPGTYTPAWAGQPAPYIPYYFNATQILATELMGQGAYYSSGGGWVLGWDHAAGAIPAQNLFDVVEMCGLEGDVFGHAGGGDTLGLACAAILRAQSHGLVLNPDTGDPVSGAGVQLRQGSTTVGTGTSRADGWYHTSGASAKPPGADISVRPAAGGDAVALGKSYTRHRHRGSFIIVPAGTPAHSPRGLNTNQGGYYASVVIRGEPRKGRVQFRRTDGPQVPLPGGFPWSVVSFVSTPGTNQGDEEPWVWYDRKDGGLHILYTRAAYDPDDPGAPPTDTRVREAVSFDDGATWIETEYTGMARRPHSMTEPGASGATLRAWYVPGNPSDTDDTNHGTIVGTFQSAGMPAQSAPFTFREYGSGSYTPLIVHDDVFGLTYAHESQGRYNLVVMIKGEGEPANFHSSDDGQTWSRVAGTGGGTEIDTMGIDDELFGG